MDKLDNGRNDEERIANNCFTNSDRIREFHEVMGVLMPTRPAVPDAATLALRHKLVQEEYEEVTSAYHKLLADLQTGRSADITQFVHELTDLLYVAYGAIQACGVDPDPIFAEVHDANMRKQDGPVRADGKRLKPPGWQPADVRGEIDRQRNGKV